jgi:hypothetical protein
MFMFNFRVRDHLRPFFLGVCTRPALLISVLLVQGVDWGLLGATLGAPELIWHEHWLLQILAGLGVTLLFEHICFVAYLDDESSVKSVRTVSPPGPAPKVTARLGSIGRSVGALLAWPVLGIVKLVIPEPQETAKGPTPGRKERLLWRDLRWYLACSWVPLVLVVCIPSIVFITTDWPWTGEDSDFFGEDQYAGRWYISEENMLVVGLSPDLSVVFPIAARWKFLLGVVLACALSRVFLHLFQRYLFRMLSLCFFARRKLRPILAWPLLIHGTIFLTFCGLLMTVAWVWHGSTTLLIFLATVMVATHASIVMFQGLEGRTGEHGRRRMHVLAGATFFSFFAVYELLFLFYWYADSHQYDWAWWISPALILCLLLAMSVALHGFFRFYFRLYYLYVSAILIVGIVLVNSTINYKQHIPGLPRMMEEPAKPTRRGAQELCFVEQLYWNRDRLPLWTADSIERYHDWKEADDLLRGQPENRAAGKKLWQLDPQQVTQAQEIKEESELDLRRVYERLHFRHQRLTHLLHPGKTPGKARDVSTLDGEELIALCKHLDHAMNDMEEDRLDVWKQQTASTKPKLAVIALSGGGSRAAVWSTVALMQLENKLTNFPRHVRIMTGTSGGMLGAAFYTATLTGAGMHQPAELADSGFSQPLANDHLTPVMQRMFFVDLPAALLPIVTDRDRGMVLEESWRNDAPALSATFDKLAEDEAQARRPSLIFTPMLVEDGRRLMISNLYLGPLTESTTLPLASERKGVQQGRRRFSLSAVELFTLFPKASEHFQLVTACRLNASFPFVCPATSLPTMPRRRVVDAGYYDNYGVNVAASWVYHHRDWIRKNTSGVVIIQISDRVDARQRLSSPREGKCWDVGRSLEELTSPLAGAASARSAVMLFRNDQQLQALSDHFNGGKDKEFFKSVLLESREDVSLNWYLTRSEIKHLQERTFKDYQNAYGQWVTPPESMEVNRLKSWWDAR